MWYKNIRLAYLWLYPFFTYPIRIHIWFANILYVSDVWFWGIHISIFHIRQYPYFYPYLKVGSKYSMVNVISDSFVPLHPRISFNLLNPPFSLYLIKLIFLWKNYYNMSVFSLMPIAPTCIVSHLMCSLGIGMVYTTFIYRTSRNIW